jgi:hypothetical protein
MSTQLQERQLRFKGDTLQQQQPLLQIAENSPSSQMSPDNPS